MLAVYFLLSVLSHGLLRTIVVQLRIVLCVRVCVCILCMPLRKYFLYLCLQLTAAAEYIRRAPTALSGSSVSSYPSPGSGISSSRVVAARDSSLTSTMSLSGITDDSLPSPSRRGDTFVSSVSSVHSSSVLGDDADAYDEEEDEEDSEEEIGSDLDLDTTMATPALPTAVPQKAPPRQLDTSAPYVVNTSQPVGSSPSPDLLSTRGRRAASKFRARPPATFVGLPEFRRALLGVGVALDTDAPTVAAPALWYAFARRFDTSDDGTVNLSEFWAVVADLLSPGVCRRMNLTFTTEPTPGHPKARWHALIEPALSAAVSSAFTRLESAFRAFDSANTGFVHRKSLPALCVASQLDFGPDLSDFLDSDSAMVSDWHALAIYYCVCVLALWCSCYSVGFCDRLLLAAVTGLCCAGFVSAAIV